MRRSDEILAAYPNQTPNGRRYLLRCLERQSITPDAPLFQDLLLEGLQEPGVGDFARLIEDAFCAKVARDRALRASGNPTEEAGEWSRFLGQADLKGGGDGAQKIERNGAATLSLVVGAFEGALGMAGPAAEAALRVLARIRTHSSLEAICRISEIEPMIPSVLSALSILGGEEASKRAVELVEAKPERLQGNPGMLVAFRGLPSNRAFDLLKKATGRPELMAGVAAALEGFGEFDYKRLMKPIILSKDPWTMMHAIESLGRMGGEQQARELSQLFERLDHAMVRMACLQALAETGSPDGADAALASLNDERPLVRAAGIEALICLPVPQKKYRDRVLKLLDSEHPRLALAAAMACVVLEPKRAARRIGQLVASGDAALLMQGIHCLAYLEHPSTAGVLATMVRNSPAGPLRSQGIWALGRRAAYNVGATRELATFVTSEDPEVRRIAAWFLAGSMPAARAEGVEAIATALPRESDPDVTAAMVESIGMAGPHGGGNPMQIAQFLRHKHAPVRKAAAWALASAFPLSDEAEELEEGSAPGAAPWGVLRRWYLEAGGMDRLQDLLGVLDPNALLETLEVARLIAMAPAFAGNADNLKGLADALRGMDLGDPESVAEVPAPRPGDTSDVLEVAAFRPAPYRPSHTQVEDMAPQVVDGIDDALPTAEAAAAAMGKVVPTEEDATEAAVAVSLFTLGKDQVEEMIKAQEAAARSQDQMVVLRVLLFFSTAVVLGQVLRYWQFYGF